MRRVSLGRIGVKVSAVSLGTWPFSGLHKNAAAMSVGWAHHDDRLARNAMMKCHELGIDHWDTADVYGDGRSEAQIGQVWEAVPRDSVFLASKVGWDAGEYDHFYHPDLIEDRLERSLKLLKTDHLDLYYMHHCDFGPDDMYLDDALAAFHKAREAGKFRYLGLSDWDCAKVARLVDRVDPDVVQVYRNVLDDAYESSGLKAEVDRRQIGVAFFSPLRHGLLTGKYEKATRFPDGDFRRNVDGFEEMAQIERFRKCVKLMAKRFASVEEPVLHALIGAILHDAPTACALVGLRNGGQASKAATAGDPLSDADATWVQDIYRAWST